MKFTKPELALIKEALHKRAIRQESESKVVENSAKAQEHRDKAKAIRMLLDRLDNSPE
ncbi:MAG TPA: hypothetical protein VGJ20_20375 [Xanthobacteraceae bacterium]|jgi:hypothetical protein